jgi:hypothetical protein
VPPERSGEIVEVRGADESSFAAATAHYYRNLFA